MKKTKTVKMAKLLQTRAKFYSRAGKLLQAWPETKYKVECALHKIESQYASDLKDAKALAEDVPVLHDKPQMPVVAVNPRGDVETSKAKSKKRQVPKVDDVLMEGRVIEDESGETRLLLDESQASSVCADAGGESLVEETILQPYEVDADEFTLVDNTGVEKLGPLMFQRIAAHALLHVYVEQWNSVYESVKLSKAQANELLRKYCTCLFIVRIHSVYSPPT